jgi:hypothetical protein
VLCRADVPEELDSPLVQSTTLGDDGAIEYSIIT